MRKSDEFTSMGELFKRGLFAIPAYQRDYAWNPRNCEVLAEDVFRIARSKESHFLGSIVVMKLEPAFKASSAQGDPANVEATTEIDVFHVVDGQQRLTSCSLFLCALRDEIREEDASCFAEGNKPTSQQKILGNIDKFLFHDEAQIGEEYAPRLYLNNDPSRQYQACLFGDDVKATGWKLRNAYRKYRDLIREDKAAYVPANIADYYIQIRNAITNYLKVDDICCDTFGSAFQIFESINAKGQPLTSVDLIKCFLMQKAKDNISDGRARWNKLLETVGASPDNSSALDRFMTVFLFTEKGERVSKMNAYDEFKRIYDRESYQTIFESLQVAADCYKQLTVEDRAWASSDPRRAFKILKLTSVYVPLLAFARHSEGGVESQDLRSLERRILPFAVRYQICGGTTNALDTPFKEMIARSKRNEPVAEIYRCLKPLTPSNDAFATAFKELTISDADEPLASYLLEQIEEFLERKDHRTEKRIPENHTLEHIIPKEFSEYIKEWGDEQLPDAFETEVVRSIGNLVLIGGRDNTSAGNRPYSEKIGRYREGCRESATSPSAGFNLLGQVVESYPEGFGVQDVQERAARLAGYACAIWE